MAACLFTSGRVHMIKQCNPVRLYASHKKLSFLEIIWPKRITREFPRYIVLPESPPDTPETNPILRINEYPKYSTITPQNVESGVHKLAISYEIAVGEHCAKLNDEKERTFQSVFDPIEKLFAPMNTAFNTAVHLSLSKGGDYTTAMIKAKSMVDNSILSIWKHDNFYKIIKEFASDKENLTDYQQKLVEKYLYEGTIIGATYGYNDEDIKNMLSHIYKSKKKIIQAVLDSQATFGQKVNDISMLSEMPKQLLTWFAEDRANFTKGPWNITLNPHNFNLFMQYCSDRQRRMKLWLAFNNRSSPIQPIPHVETDREINTIRRATVALAKSMGYENYVEMVMENRMAGNVDNVLNMFESLKTSIKPCAEEEIANLQEFVASVGHTDKLEMWDIPYWTRRHKQHLFRLNNDLVAEYFPLSNVLKYLFSVSKELFGITIQECTNEVDVCDEGVHLFKVNDAETNEEIAAFLLDPFSEHNTIMDLDPIQHPGQELYVNCGRDRCDLLHLKPFSHLTLNLSRPLGEQPVLLSVEKTAELFCKFGQGLQQMLSVAPYSSLAGLNNVEKDAAYVMPELMKLFFYNKNVLKAVSSHVDSGESLPEDVIDTVIQRENYFKSFNLMKELYVSAFDVEFFINDDHWNVLKTNLWKEFIPLPLHLEDNHPYSMVSIFSVNENASVYSRTWSKMVAADIFYFFEEAGFDDFKKLAPVGKRLKETFLTQSGCLPSNELFRRFSGRDLADYAFLSYNAKPK